MIFDCFLFFNEFDLLDIRLHELCSVVDKFVIIESTVTHSKKIKPLNFKWQKRFEPFLSKMVHLEVPADKCLSLNIENNRKHNIENFQRNYINDFLSKNAEDGDILIVSDIDEIPHVSNIKHFVSTYSYSFAVARFKTKLYRYYYNLYFQDWQQGFIAMYCKDNANFDWSIHRQDKRKCSSIPLMQDAEFGWHFSTVGNIDHIMSKLTNFAHAGEHKDKIETKRIKMRMENKLHPIKNNKAQGKIVPISEMPFYIRDNKGYFKSFLLKDE